MFIESDFAECITLLEKAIHNWPRMSIELEEAKAFKNQISNYLTDSFSEHDLLCPIQPYSKVLKSYSVDALLILEFIDVDAERYKATFEKIENKWGISNITFECPVCFGEGINNGESCPVCEGIGWGAGRRT